MAMLLGGNDQRESAQLENWDRQFQIMYSTSCGLFGAVLNRLERGASSDKFSNPIGAAPLQSSDATL